MFCHHERNGLPTIPLTSFGTTTELSFDEQKDVPNTSGTDSSNQFRWYHVL